MTMEEMEKVLTEIRNNFQLFQSKQYPTVKEPLAYYNLPPVGTPETTGSEYWKSVNCVLVHYPTLVIRNSAEYAHIIQDLWVCIHLSSNLRLRRISVIRSTVTNKEFEKEYTFSHATKGNPFDSFKSLCFGRGDVADYIRVLVQQDYSHLRWLELPQYLYDYFQWESLEGGPYFEISRLFESASLKWSIRLTDSCFKKINCCSARALVNALLKYDEQRLMKDVIFSYKEGTLNIAPLYLDRLYYNIYTVLKEYNEAEMSTTFNGLRDYIKYRGVVYQYQCGWGKYILTKNSFTLPYSASSDRNYQDDVLMFTLPDGKEIKSKIIDKESEVHSYEIYMPSFHLATEIAGAYIRKKNPIKYNYL